MQKKQVESLFILAKIEILKLYELKNQYWPEVPSYYETILKSPWWLVKTKYGNIVIGRRKRVTHIDWEDTPIRKIISKDDVTKENHYIHAWTDLKCVEYLINLNNEFESINNSIVVEKIFIKKYNMEDI